jgi:hypothetical protein
MLITVAYRDVRDVSENAELLALRPLLTHPPPALDRSLPPSTAQEIKKIIIDMATDDPFQEHR